MKRIKEILSHRKAFRTTEMQLTGKISIAGWLHDFDKILLSLILPRRIVSKIHRSYSFHHPNNIWGVLNSTQAIIDWQCASLTKSDKPLNARDTLNCYYPQFKAQLNPVLDKLGL